MAKLPQAIDYGPRPSVGVNRLDRPSAGGVELAEALSSAVNTFDGVMKERKAKEDRLNYGLARNEIQKADLEARDELTDDQDWAAHDEKYTTSFSKKRDEIMARYGLSQHDSAILSSESDLIGTQGRISVGGNARKIEVDQGRAAYLSGRSDAKLNLERATDGPSRNNIVLGQLDVIEAAEEKGYLTAEQAQSERETTTQDFALSSITAMSKPDQVRVLSASLAYRKGYSADLGQYSDEVIAASEAHGIPAEVIAAQIQKESSGNAAAISKAGAQGLLQLREAAAEEMGVTDRFDPAQSISGGTKYLAKQLKRFEDPAEALAAYNWGPGNLLEAKDKYGDDWLAHAPEETKDYVAALLPVWESAGEVKTNGSFSSGEGPLDADAIRSGKGTGSIADFLHADTAAKMLEAAKTSDKINQDRTAAQSINSMAMDLFPEDGPARLKWIGKNSSGTVQELAETNERQTQQDARNERIDISTGLTDDLSLQMETEGLRYAQIDVDTLGELTDAHRLALKARSDTLSRGERWPSTTQFYDAGDGSMSMEEWNEMEEYGPGSKADQNLNTPLFQNAFAEKEFRQIELEQAQLQANEAKKITTNVMQPKARIDLYLSDNEIMQTNERTPEQRAMASRLQSALQAEIVTFQETLVPQRALTEAENREALLRVLEPIAFTDTDFFWFDSDYDPEEATPVALMTPAQKEKAFIDLDRANITNGQIIYKGQKMNTEGVLRRMAKDWKIYSNTLSDNNLRRAAFALVNDLGDAEVVRRLKGE